MKKKSSLAEAYEKYLWPKCSKTTFYRNVGRWMLIHEAIKPITHSQRYKTGRIKTTKFSKELERYYKQEWIKVDRMKFYQRLYQWHCKEDAIQIKMPERPKDKIVIKNIKTYTYNIPQWSNRKPTTNDNEIRIRYKKEEADVIKKEYERMLYELENTIVDNPEETKTLRTRIENLEKEYEVFISYNQ